MKKRIIIFSVILSAAVIWAVSCSFDAERDNILDPNGDGSTPPASISGTVTRKNSAAPLQGVVVSLSPGNMGSVTDSDGRYSVNIYQPGNYQVTVSHSGYKTITATLPIEFNSYTTHNYQMDAKVVFDSVSATSQYVATSIGSPPTVTLKAYIYSEISDPDGSSDLDSAMVKVIYLDQERLLSTTSANVYNTLLSSLDCPFSDPDSLEFTISVVDNQDDTSYSEPFYIKRIINIILSINSPNILNGTGEVSGRPSFKWGIPDSTRLMFDYNYRVSVFYLNDPDVLRYVAVLPKDSPLLSVEFATSLKYTIEDDSLEFDNYYWTLQLEDAYGDFTRSMQFEFEVNQ